LPDSVANQIAAGEVVQRPASVVKELVENAIDAGATQVTLVIKDAGKTLIQVKDNGHGMSDRDARMAFERHATSKITEIDDLEHLITFGFRGEALASIAAVAEVELKTKLHDEELGVRLLIAASKVTASEPVQCPSGSVFSVKNLFFNIPARRKFLRTDAAELKQIINEMQRVAICNLNVEFNFINNGTTIYNLPKSNLKQRLAGLFGKNISASLIDVQVETSMINIHGVVGKPDKAKKTQGEQFLFVNKRFFRSHYFQKAVIKAYEQLLPPDMHPSYFLLFEINPANIDVNIHPQKTEVKFADETAIWQIVHAVVREALSKYAVAPSIIFDMEDAPNIPVIDSNTKITAPTISVNENFNPFKNDAVNKVDGWEQLYENFNKIDKHSVDELLTSSLVEPEQQTVFAVESTRQRFLQVKNKYIVTCVKSGIMLVDICRAHQRILFERFMSMLQGASSIVSQQMLFPETVEISIPDFMIFKSVCDNLRKMGFDIRDFDTGTLMFCAMPAGLEKTSAKSIVDEILHNIKEDYNNPVWNTQEKLAQSLAKAEAVKKCETMTDEEIEYLINKLFACKMPDIDAEGKPTISIITMEEMDKLLKH
jgi:DNA mismatch repair protein MutL